MATTLESLESRSTPEPMSGCLLWTGYQNANGYGSVSWNGMAKLAHRVAWELRHGAIPSGLCVMHRCDNRLCLEDRHHQLGTYADNNVDRMTKGRHRALLGSENGSSKLTADQVRSIRASTVDGKTLAKFYGVSQQLMSRIRRREAWRHVA